jgi:hypothetical protein
MSWEDYVDEGGNGYSYQDGYIDDIPGTTGVDPGAAMGSGDIDLGWTQAQQDALQAEYAGLAQFDRPEVMDDGAVVYKQADGTYVDMYGNKMAADKTYVAGESPSTVFTPTQEQTSSFDKWLSGVPDAVKGYFTKKDSAGKDVTDWTKVLQSGLGIASLTGLNASARKPSGYQGGVPSVAAYRDQVANTYDPNRRPGSGGRRYFSDVIYAPEAQGTAASNLVQAQADVLARRNAANPANQTMPVGTSKSAADIAKSGIYSGTPSMPTPTFDKSKYLPIPAPVGKAEGGLMEMAKGRYLRGETDGMEDKIPATIDKNQPARLSHGEFVIPADVVSHLGNGNSDAGAKHLYKMMDKIRHARTGTKKQGKQINAEKFMPKYAKGGIASFAVGGVTAPAGTSGQDQSLASYAGPGITDYLSRGQALSKEGYQAYTGPLTAGPSDLQNKAFTSAGNLNVPTGQMGAFTPSTFGADQANAYMNPYLQSALDPVLKEQRRQAEINNLSGMGSLTKAGAFGGGRQAIMESEGLRNLLDLQTKTLGEGYRTAYDKASDQFNKEQGFGLQAQTAANQYGLQALQEQAGLGAQQRGITAEGVAADRAQFEEEKLDPYKKVEYAQKLYSGLPITAASYDVPQQNDLQKLLAALAIAMPDTFGKSTATK